MPDLLAYTWQFDALEEALPSLLDGVLITVQLTAVTMVLGLVAGMLVALLRISRWRVVRGATYLYTELFRTTPILVQLIWFFYVLPQTFDVSLPTFWLGVLALSLNVTAYVAEIFRSTILSVDRGQREAALATGMTNLTAMRRIVLPQAVRRAIPLLAATWVSLFKDTSLTAVIGVHELTYEGREIALATYRPLETFTVVALMYFLLTYPQSLLVDRLFHRFRVAE
jgi:His/Glu/Gln/Arg/opine family amino acid ABC transporter permease subunit